MIMIDHDAPVTLRKFGGKTKQEFTKSTGTKETTYLGKLDLKFLITAPKFAMVFRDLKSGREHQIFLRFNLIFE